MRTHEHRRGHRRDMHDRNLPGGPFRADGPRRRGHHPHGDEPGLHPHRGGRGVGGPRGGRRGRAQRGDVRAAVLRLLGTEPMHGYQLMEAIADRTGGAWRPSPGAIYPTISQLEDEGLVTVEKEGGRKLVSLTDAGRSYVDDPGSELIDPFAGHDPDAGGPDLRLALRELQGAARSVATSGSDAEVAAAHAVLTEAKKSLYRILAGDVETPGEK
ncbi:PadR family transcriptional regulator [Rhodococcus sp. B50]|uniref:PadR family transcriptional regulator n=1 Tax=Rhodococcus sp. B50 TaxID=2682847 RepID=UPI001BD2B117|nr:PadR family transcriptional regulator [Rhodococcus sp. B50]MBS9374257.1 Transcriptional regulator YqjI [Rhodococcus sp. B50]